MLLTWDTCYCSHLAVFPKYPNGIKSWKINSLHDWWERRFAVVPYSADNLHTLCIACLSVESSVLVQFECRNSAEVEQRYKWWYNGLPEDRTQYLSAVLDSVCSSVLDGQRFFENRNEPSAMFLCKQEWTIAFFHESFFIQECVKINLTRSLTILSPRPQFFQHEMIGAAYNVYPKKIITTRWPTSNPWRLGRASLPEMPAEKTCHIVLSYLGIRMTMHHIAARFDKGESTESSVHICVQWVELPKQYQPVRPPTQVLPAFCSPYFKYKTNIKYPTSVAWKQFTHANRSEMTKRKQNQESDA